MTEERRRSHRMRAYLPVQLHKAHTPQMIETLTKDVSADGLRCVSSTLCPVSTEVSIELALPSGHEVLELRGRTAWFRMIPHSDQFDIGIAFHDVSPQTKIRLSAYIERLSDQTSAVPA